MFVYEKRLQYPVHITRPDPAMAARLISQYGGPDGELSAAMRYLSQRYSMPLGTIKGLLTDIAVEELGHLEIVGAMIYQLTRCLTHRQIRAGGFYLHALVQIISAAEEKRAKPLRRAAVCHAGNAETCRYGMSD